MKHLLLCIKVILFGIISNAQDLGISYVNYSNGQLLNSTNLSNGRIETAFTITNYGNSVVNSSDEVYVSARINGTYYKLDLTSTGSSFLVPGSTIGVNGSFTNNPGYLDGPLSLSFLGVSSLEVCVLVYGVGISSVNTNFIGDPNPCNNITCVLYSNSITSYNNDCVTTSIFSSKSQLDILTYPQPFINELNINLSKSISAVDQLIITDYSGTVVYKSDINGMESKWIDTSRFSRGMYLLTFYYKNEIIGLKKIIKE
jgi:hypothetical protein